MTERQLSDAQVFKALSSSLGLLFQSGLAEHCPTTAEAIAKEVAGRMASVEFVIRFAKIASLECWLVRPTERIKLFETNQAPLVMGSKN